MFSSIALLSLKKKIFAVISKGSLEKEEVDIQAQSSILHCKTVPSFEQGLLQERISNGKKKIR
jgi:hypothetical protein